MVRALSPWLLLTLAAALAACSGSSGGATDTAADTVEVADTAAPDVTTDTTPADGVGKDTGDAGPDTPDPGDVPADVPPVPTWHVTTEAAEPTTDAWVRVVAGTPDAATGTLDVDLEVSAFASVLGVSFHLGVDPELAEVTAVTPVYAPTQSGSTKWGLLARSGTADVQGALAIMRSGDAVFGSSGSQLSGALSESTVLYRVQLTLKKPGTLHVSLDFPDTVAVAPDWTTLPLERLGLTVTSTQEVTE